MRYFSLLLILFLASCATPEPIVRYHTVEVKVPVQVKAVPPKILRTPPSLMAPVFVPPSDPEASSALTKKGEQQLKLLLLKLHNRDQAWRAWGG